MNGKKRFGSLGVAAGLLLAGSAGAEADSCREWRAEHCQWKAVAISRYLSGAPQRELDEAMFEILQREAYLTSCEASVESSRSTMVGWRLVGRAPDEYSSTVLEALLEKSGFDLALRDTFGGEPQPVVAKSTGGPWPRFGARRRHGSR